MNFQPGTSRRSLIALAVVALCLLLITGALLWNTFPFQKWFSDRTAVAELYQPTPGRAMHVRGTVTYANSSYLCLQDTSAGFCFHYKDKARTAAGNVVDVWAGVPERAQSQELSISRVAIKGRDSLPQPVPASIGVLPQGTRTHSRLTLSGVVRSASLQQGTLTLRVAARPDAGDTLLDSPEKNVPIEASVLNPGLSDISYLLDSEISLTGVIAPGSVTNEPMRQNSGLLMVASKADMKVLQPAPAQQVLVPSLRALLEAHSLISAGHRIRIRGRVVAQDLQRRTLFLASESGVLPVDTAVDFPVKPGNYVEVLGFPNSTEYKRLPTALLEISIQNATYRLLNQEEARAQDAAEKAALENTQLPVLRDIASIRQLTTPEARRYYPVRIEGVVTFTRPQPLFHYFFVQDATGGIYIDSNDLGENLRVGDRVRVTGITSPGGFAPIVTQAFIENLGPGTLPRPSLPSMEQVSSGSMDCRLVEIEGIVHPLKRTRGGQVYFELFTSVGRVRAALGFVPDERVERLVDAKVHARGVLGSSFNQQRQLTGLVMFLARFEDLAVIGPPPPDPSTIPVLPVDAVSQYSPRGDSNHRIRVRGAITMVRASKHLYIGDSSGGLEVFADASSLQPGDVVEAIGYGAPGTYSPILQDATVKKVGAGTAMTAPLITVEQALSGKYDNQLVQMEGQLVNSILSSNEQTLMMRSRDYTFTAHMEGSKDAGGLDSVRDGSIVRLTGICSVQVDPAQMEFNNSRIPQSFRMLFRSPADVTVVKEAPWWNLRRTLILLGLMTLAVMLALVWVIVLGRRVHSQTAELQASKRVAEEAREVAELAHTQSKALIENAPYGIATLDAEGALLEANPAFRKIADIDRDAPVTGILLRDLLRFRPDCDERLTAALHSGRSFQHMELICMHRHGSPVALRVSGMVASQPLGDARVIEIITEDITSQRQLEQQLLQSQRVEAVGRLAGGIAHDFNNLLMIISSYTSMLAEQFEPYSSEGRKLHAVEEAAQRAAALTHQLLAYSRKQMLEPKVLHIDGLIANLKDMLRRLIREDVDIRFHLLSREARVKVDPSQLEQVLINLAVNARDAMPTGGALTVRTERTSSVNGNMPAGEYALVSVSDTGIGMDKSTQERIFEPFFTTKELGKGTGLGLSMVYGIIKQSGGFIFVDSVPGMGTTFRIYLPLVDAPPQIVADPKFELRAASGKETIFVVEDQPEVRTLICESLKQHGYRTMQANNGEEGLAIATEHLNKIDMIITDVIMPKMSGFEFREKVRALRPDLVVLFISGYTDHEVGAGALDPSTQFLQKPFSPRTLVAKVQEMLASRRTATPDQTPYQLPLQ